MYLFHAYIFFLVVFLHCFGCCLFYCFLCVLLHLCLSHVPLLFFSYSAINSYIIIYVFIPHTLLCFINVNLFIFPHKEPLNSTLKRVDIGERNGMVAYSNADTSCFRHPYWWDGEKRYLFMAAIATLEEIEKW